MHNLVLPGGPGKTAINPGPPPYFNQETSMVSYIFLEKSEFVGHLKGLAAKADGKAEAKDSQKDKAFQKGQAAAYRDIADMFEQTFFKSVSELSTE